MTRCQKSLTNSPFLTTNKSRKLENLSKFANLRAETENRMGHINNIKTSWIIHIFAALHAIATLGCRYIGVNDEMVLTMLTIAMVVIICFQKKLNIEFTAPSIIIVKVVGYIMGNLGAKLFQMIIDSSGIVHALSTFLTTEIIGWSIIFMVNHVLNARIEVKEEREKANMAQYRYIKLKHQVNPHFLFNSLNILDGLICDGQQDRASTYTHKLAGIYRYMLKSEEEIVVPLRDELVFVGLYVDLLNERFPSGFHVEISVPEELTGRFVLSCSLQLLIENATKHNAVSEENPLVVRVEASGDSITVTNNIIPKVTKIQSTGLGQTYIRQMYQDITGRQIAFKKTETTYSVTLPLI